MSASDLAFVQGLAVWLLGCGAFFAVTWWLAYRR